MKKRTVIAASCVALILTTGCSMQGGMASSAASTMMTSTAVSEIESTSSVPSAEKDMSSEKESSITGTISDIKDFMFVLTDESGTDYALSFEGEKPEGLSSVQDGDTVVVVYTGKLEELEAFTGTVISVTKK